MVGKLGHPKKAAFLAAYAECGIVSKACKLAEVGRATHYVWINEDDEYKTAFEEAHRIAIEAMECEARRRAMEGWLEPVFYQGEECGYVRKFSDTLLIFMMKGAMPEKYRERFEHSGTIEQTGKIEHEHSLRELQRHPDYVNYLRHRTSHEDCDAGAICQIREPGGGQPLENGSAHGDPGQGTNGHRNGQE